MVNIRLFVILSLMAGCKNSSSDNSIKAKHGDVKKLKEAAWIIGSWQMATSTGSLYENWREASDTLLVGKSFSVKNADTVLIESINIVEHGGEIDYIPTVRDQNEGLPIKFRLTYIDSNKLVFENMEHDFPQQIIYVAISRDSLIAEISGTINGEHRFRKFPMKRIP